MIDKLISSVKNNCVVPGIKLKDSARVLKMEKQFPLTEKKL